MKSLGTPSLAEISARLAAAAGGLRFGPPVSRVYNPLVYAARPHAEYLRLYGAAPKRVVFLGMNPGPWGMAQTGVPFGEVDAVREWLGIEAPVGKPAAEHPKRPVTGFACRRSEVSGRRLWGLFRSRFGTPDVFFRDNYVANYCPLVFMNEGGANITPDKLPAAESGPLYEICDRALADTIRLLRPRWVVGIGRFAEKRILAVSRGFFSAPEAPGFEVASILHPSPASPRANRGWEAEAESTLATLGLR